MTNDFGPYGASNDDRFVSGSLDPALDEEDLAADGQESTLRGLDDVNVNVVTGNLLLRGPEGRKDGRELYYNSFAAIAEDYGAGWRGTDGAMVRLDAGTVSDTVVFVDPTGARHTFEEVASDTYETPRSFAGRLSVDPNGVYRVTDDRSGRWYEFSGLGTAAARLGGRGLPAALIYSAGKLLEARRADDHAVAYARGSGARVSSVDASAANGENRTYEYTSGGLLESSSGGNEEVAYAYDTVGRLTGVLTPAGTHTTFAYVGTTRKVSTVTTDALDEDPVTVSLDYQSDRTIVSSDDDEVTYFHDGTVVTRTETPSAPTLSLSGSFWAARGTTLSASSYELTFAADGDGSDEVEHIEFFANGEPIDHESRSCASGCSAVNKTFTVNTEQLPEGAVRIRAVAATAGGFLTEREFDVTVPVVPSVPVNGPPPTTQAQRYAAATSFRERFSLDASLTTVAAADASPAAQPARYRWGVPLTPTEAARLDDRMQLQFDSHGVQESVADPDEFAGGYLADTATGSEYRVGFTANLVTNVNLVKADSSLPNKIVGFAATYSLEELEDKQREVERSVELGEPDTEKIVLAAADIPSNRVRIEVSPYSTATKTALEAEYGPEVEVVEGERPSAASLESSREDFIGDRRMGGQRITANPHGYNWTLGFAAESDPWLAPRPSGKGWFGKIRRVMPSMVTYDTFWKRSFLTAGHCIWDDDDNAMTGGSTWVQGGRGFALNRMLALSVAPTLSAAQFGVRADALALEPFARRFWGTPITLGAEGFAAVIGYRPDGATQVGDAVCFSGATSATVNADFPMCGLVSRGSHQVLYPMEKDEPNGAQVVLDRSVSVDAECGQGDSGGPVYSYDDEIEGVVAEGVVAATSSTTCWFSTIEGVEEEMRERGLEKFHVAGSSPVEWGEDGQMGQWVPPFFRTRTRASNGGGCPTPTWANFGFRNKWGRCMGGFA